MAITRQFAPQLAVLKYINAPRTGQCTFGRFVELVMSRQPRHGHNSEKGILLDLLLFFMAAHVRLDGNLQHPTIGAFDIQRQPRTACVVVFRALAGALVDGLIL